MLLPTVPRTRVRPTARPAIATPFGPLTFVTAVGDTALPSLPEELFDLPGGRTIARWALPSARVELLLTPYDAELDPDHWGPLTDCRAAVWRIDALAPLPRVWFSASVPEQLPEGADAYWDGGQGLTAITVEDESTKLTIGGNDEEAICLAADAREVPRRWAALLDEVYERSSTTWGVNVNTDADADRGIVWRLPPLEAGEHCELPVVAAWASAADETENTWFAVMPSPTWLLRQAAAAVATPPVAG